MNGIIGIQEKGKEEHPKHEKRFIGPWGRILVYLRTWGNSDVQSAKTSFARGKRHCMQNGIDHNKVMTIIRE